MAALYFVAMMAGAFGYRVPPEGWRPEGMETRAKTGMVTHGQVDLANAHRTPQFWLIWLVLMFNVSAGIGVLGMASPMLQEIFTGTLLGKPTLGFAALDTAQKTQIAGIAAGFVGLLSLFNIAGRFFWASISDHIGRKLTYATFFGLGLLLYAVSPTLAHTGQLALFVAAFCVILSMYGGGFATVPAYLADMFGTQYVGAIHGRLLTAWSTAGIVGPVVVNYIREAQIAAGVDRAAVYDRTMYILAGMLVLGMICNLLIRPVAPRWFMSDAELAAVRAHASQRPAGAYGIDRGGLDAGTAIAWTMVGIPVLWGVWITLSKAWVLFG
jgi:MFS family permease